MDSLSDGYPPTRADEKGLSLVARLTTMSRILVGDPVCFTQVISNLLSNAIKFTDQQGIGEYILPFYE